MALGSTITQVTDSGLKPGITFPSFVSSGVATATNFKTGTTNVHSTGIEAGGINVNGGDTKIGTGATVWKDGGALFSGIVTATSFVGDISNATGAAAGLGTALSQTQTNPLNKIYYTDSILSVGSTITINPPSSASAAYTQYTDIVATGDADIIVADGDDFVPDILGIATGTAVPYSGTGGRIRAGQFTNTSANGAPTATNGWIVTGVSTATTFKGNLIGNVTGTASQLETNATGANLTLSGNLGVAGTLTYEDVTRVDAVGLSTFREGLEVGPLAGIALTAYKDGSIRTTGVITATTYYGSGAQLTGIDATQIVTGNTSVQTVDTGSDGHVKVNIEGNQKARFDSSGRLLLGGPSTTVPIASTANSTLQVHSANTLISAGLCAYGNSAAGSVLALGKTRASTVGTVGTAVQAGDILGEIRFSGDDGTDVQSVGAYLQAVVDAAPASNAIPSRLEFRTYKDPSSGTLERLRITKDGAWGLGGANYGTDGQVLTSKGNAANPAWEDAGGGLFSRAWYDMDTTETTITGASGETRVGGNSGANLEVTWTPPSTATKYVYVCYLHFRFQNGGQWGWQPEFTSNNWTSKTGIGNHPSFGNEYPNQVIRHGLVQVGDFHPNTTNQCKMGLFATVWSSHSPSIVLNGSLQKSRIFLYEVADASLFNGI